MISAHADVCITIHPQSFLWRSFGPLWMPFGTSSGHPLDILWTSSGHPSKFLETFLVVFSSKKAMLFCFSKVTVSLCECSRCPGIIYLHNSTIGLNHCDFCQIHPLHQHVVSAASARLQRGISAASAWLQRGFSVF